MTQAHSSSRTRQGGFTLIEIMVVIVILGLLVGIVGPNVWKALTQSEDQTCRAEMRNILQAVELYQLENKRKIPTIEDLITPDEQGEAYLSKEEEPLDPWDTPFEIREGDRRGKAVIVSAGPDGEFDTEDDLRTDDKTNDEDN